MGVAKLRRVGWAIVRGACLLAVLLASPGASSAQEVVRIGVLAHRGIEVATREWEAHGRHLAQALPSRHFVIQPMAYDALSRAVRERAVDFVITNTGHYTELELTGDVTRIATRLVAGPRGPLDRFGGVLIAPAAAGAAVTGYGDLHGRILLVPDRSSLGGWQMHLREAHDLGVDLDAVAGAIVETHNHEEVVRGLLAGRGDVGFVRADVLEAMATAGELDLRGLRVVAARSDDGYPYLHSTRLYPEWPFASVQGTSEDLAREVLIALLRMAPESEAARAAGIHGWTVPLSYKPVDELFRLLHLGPYGQLDFALRDVARRFWPLLVAAALTIIALLALAVVRVVLSHRRMVAEMARRAEAERRLRTLSIAVEQGPASVIITDADRRIVYVDQAFRRVSGYGAGEVEGQDVSILKSGLTPDSTYRDMWDALRAGQAWSGDLCNLRKDGSRFWERAIISPVMDAGGRVVNYLAIKQDVTLERSYEDALAKMTHFDPLTGLANRTLAHDRLERLCLDGEEVAVLRLAVDHLGRVKESLGQQACDRVMATLAQRFKEVCQPADTVARLGGDDFLVLRPAPRGESEIDQLATALLAEASRPVTVDEVEIRMTVRAGIALRPRDGAEAIELQKAAYTAATRAREAGGNTWRYFLPAMNEEARWRLAAESGLRQALAQGGLELYLQPYVDATSGFFRGAEALIRWRRPGEGFVPPARFLPVAESTGLIRDIDRWVIAQAAAAAAELRAELGRVYPVAVNVSPADLHDTAIVDFTIEVLRRHRLPPEALEIEVTEAVFLADEARDGAALRAFAAHGIPIAIDDFGTGYSSLGHLRRYPVSKVKIDRSFVGGIDSDPKLQGLAAAIAAMARNLGLEVTAEGVERHAEWERLRDAGCDYIQGFLFARPTTLAELKRLVKIPELTA